MMKKPLVQRVCSAYGNAEIATAEIDMAAQPMQPEDFGTMPSTRRFQMNQLQQGRWILWQRSSAVFTPNPLPELFNGLLK
jgi:hypothetical protein